MKKLMIVPIMTLGMLFATNANAQVDRPDRDADKKARTEMQDKYSKVEVNTLPPAVKASAERDFEGSTISEAHKAEDGSYKLLLVNKNGEKGWVYADKNGKWIQPKTSTRK